MEGSAHSVSVSVGSWYDVGARIAEARRRAGLSRKVLAKQLGISLWMLEELEGGRKNAAPYVAYINRATAIRLELEPTTALSSDFAAEQSRPSIFSSRARDVLLAATGRELVLGSIALLVLIRFFTEVVHVIPRAANFIDIPIFFTLAVAAMARPQPKREVRKAYMPVALPVMLFLGLCVLSAMTNFGRVDTGPVLVFIYGFVAPLGIYAAVYRLWPPGSALSLSQLLVALGVFQLVVVFTIDLSRFLSSGRNPDLISGTFGTNAYQLVFFLLLVVGLLAGIFTFEPRRLAARFAPTLFLLILTTVFLAQYRALLVTTVLSILLVGILLGPRARGVMAAVLIGASLVFALRYVSTHFPGLKFATTISSLTQSPGFYASKRLDTARSVERLYTDTPRFILTGSGPGTFSSRAWQTFASSTSKSRSNVQGAYASVLTGGSAYHTDVSDKYVQPELTNATIVLGSGAVTSPYSDYLSLLAETGIFGFLLIVGVYAGATAHALRLTREALRNPVKGDPLPGLLIASVVAFTVLLQMGVLGNWLEVTRLTFISWAILAVVSKEIANRETRSS